MSSSHSLVNRKSCAQWQISFLIKGGRAICFLDRTDKPVKLQQHIDTTGKIDKVIDSAPYDSATLIGDQIVETEFWHQKWENNEIGFHQSEANPLLVKYFSELSLAQGSRVFVPLCGKTLDIHWLLSRGYRVAGAELSKIAIEQLFAELGVEPKISALGELVLYSAKNIDIFVGDIFELSAKTLGPVDAIYDRAALVALPETMRHQYTAHLAEITHKAPQLLICFEYDQSLQAGPPFSISTGEVNQHYKDVYDLTLKASINLPGGLKGKCAAKENVWLLKNER